MSVYSPTKDQRLSSPSIGFQLLVALMGGMLVAVFFLMVASLVFNLQYAGRIYPGVSIAGIPVGGLSSEQAASLLAQRLSYVETGRVVFQDGEQVWIARPAELGVILDAQTSATAAYNLGRSGNPLSRLYGRIAAWHSGRDLPPVMVYDQRMAYHYLQQIAEQSAIQRGSAARRPPGTPRPRHPGSPPARAGRPGTASHRCRPAWSTATRGPRRPASGA